MKTKPQRIPFLAIGYTTDKSFEITVQTDGRIFLIDEDITNDDKQLAEAIRKWASALAAVYRKYEGD